MTVDPKPTIVIGLGNPMRHDDGVGAAAVELLEQQPPVDVDMIVLDGESTRLIEAWTGRTRAILVDAVVAGEPPGTIHELEVGGEALPDWDTAVGGTHAAGLAEAVALGRALDRLPAELVVLGVEPGDVSHGPGLSTDVAAALPDLADRIRARTGG